MKATSSLGRDVLIPLLREARAIGHANVRYPMKFYCEHGGISKQLLEYQRQRLVELLHFPYDRHSISKHIARTARPSKVPWADIHMPWIDMIYPWTDYGHGSEHYDAILSIVGRQNHRDALALDSAYKSECLAFITRDRRDIVRKRAVLEALLNLRIFHPDSDQKALREFVGHQK